MNRQAWRDFFITLFFLGLAFIIALLSSAAADQNTHLAAAAAAGAREEKTHPGGGCGVGLALISLHWRVVHHSPARAKRAARDSAICDSNKPDGCRAIVRCVFDNHPVRC